MPLSERLRSLMNKWPKSMPRKFGPDAPPGVNPLELIGWIQRHRGSQLEVDAIR